MKNSDKEKDLTQYPENIKEKIKRRRLQMQSHQSEREKYVDAIESFKKFKKDRSYFWHLLLNLEKDKVRNMIEFANKPMEENLKYNDPALYNFLEDVLTVFKESNFHKKNYELLFEHLEKETKPKKTNKL